MFFCTLFPFAMASDFMPLRDFATEVISAGGELPSIDPLRHFLQARFSSEKSRHEFHRLDDRIEYILFLRSRVVFFEKNNALLKSFISASYNADPMIAEQLEHLIRDEKQVFTVSQSLDFLFREDVDSLDEVHLILKDIEASLVVQLKKMQVINDGLRLLKIQTLAGQRDIVSNRKKDEYVNQLLQMQIKLQEKDGDITRQEQSIKDLQGQINQLTLGMDIFRDRLQSAGVKMDRLMSDIATASLDLYQKEQEVVDSRQQAEDMATEFRETRERLLLVQRIIQEKDVHIQKLEEELSQIQIQLGSNQGDGSLDVLRQEMRDSVAHLRVEMASNQEKIQRLEEKFKEVALANAQLESELIKKNFLVSLLEKQTVQKDELIMDLEKGFQVRTQQLSELRGIVKIYQMKLRDYKQMLEEHKRLLREFEMGRASSAEPGSSSASAARMDQNETFFQLPDMILWSPEKIRDVSKEALEQVVQ
jgi:chromosome segregation ATPase